MDAPFAFVQEDTLQPPDAAVKVVIVVVVVVVVGLEAATKPVTIVCRVFAKPVTVCKRRLPV